MRLEARVNPRVEQRPSQRMEAALRKITRAIMNLNGTQYGVLSEPAVLTDDSEMEFMICLSNISGSEEIFIGKSSESRGFIRANKGIVEINCTTSSGATAFSELPVLEAGKIYRVVVRRVGSSVTVSYSGQSQTITGMDVSNTTFDMLAGKQFVRFSGSFFHFKLWNNGDRNNGQLVTDLRFDEPDTIYQKNYTFTSEKNISAIGNPSEFNKTVPYYTLNRDDPQESGFYLAELTVHRVDHGDVKINLEGTDNDTNFFSEVGTYQLAFHTDVSIFCAVQAGGAGFGGAVSLSLKKWSGCTLKNVLPGDWEAIRKRLSDNFWLGKDVVYPSTIQDWNKNITGASTITDIGSNQVMISSPDNDYAAVTLAGALELGFSYRVSGVVDVQQGNFSVNIGPNSELIPEVDPETGSYEYFGLASIEAVNLKRYGDSLPDLIIVTTPKVEKYLEYTEGAL